MSVARAANKVPIKVGWRGPQSHGDEGPHPGCEPARRDPCRRGAAQGSRTILGASSLRRHLRSPVVPMGRPVLSGVGHRPVAGGPMRPYDSTCRGFTFSPTCTARSRLTSPAAGVPGGGSSSPLTPGPPLWTPPCATDRRRPRPPGQFATAIRHGAAAARAADAGLSAYEHEARVQPAPRYSQPPPSATRSAAPRGGARGGAAIAALGRGRCH